jgi:hypothetical protein
LHSGTTLCAMNTSGHLLRLICSVSLFFALASPSFAQHPAEMTSGKDTVVLTKLAPPVYPQIALIAQIQGDVDVLLKIDRNGGIDSTTVVSGPPLLLRAAQSSAEQSQFKCLNCVEQTTPYHLVYSFKLIRTSYDPCKNPDAQNEPDSNGNAPQVVVSKNHVTVASQPRLSCGIVVAKKVRSVKCLYLWRCGWSF